MLEKTQLVTLIIETAYVEMNIAEFKDFMLLLVE